MSEDNHKYSEEEMQRTLTKEILKFQLAALSRDVDVLKQTSAKDLTEIKTQIGQVIEMIKEQSHEQEKNRKEFKAEIEKEFASKVDLARLENKLDSLWLRITVTVGVLVTCGLFFGWILGVFNSVKSLTH